jgi:hypothetical protein
MPVRRQKRWLRPSKSPQRDHHNTPIAGRNCVPRCVFRLPVMVRWWYGGCMVHATLLLVVALQAPAGAGQSATPPQNPPTRRLLERQQMQPSRVRARENLARDPNEPDPAEMAPEPTPEPELPEPTPAPAVAPAPAPAVQPAVLAPMVPSVIAPGSTATNASPAVAIPSIGAAPAPTGAKAKFVFDPQPLAPLTMLVGPAIGALWLVTRRGVGSSAG